MTKNSVFSTALPRRRFLAGSASLLALPAILRANRALGATSELPDYYPTDYQDIIAGSRDEGGVITIYSNISESNWRPIVAGFTQKFPWTTVKTTNLGNAEVFQRYYNETATGVFTADMVFNNAPRHWLKFIEGNNALPYDSPERSRMPEWSVQIPGIYHLSSEPMVMAYNKLLLPEDKWPRGIRHLGELIAADPATFRGKITTFSIDEAVGFDLTWKYVLETENAWESLGQILPEVRPEVSSGTSVEKLTTGEALAGYFVSGPILWPRLTGGVENVLGWHYIEEGQPLALRTLCITKTTRKPNTAKLFLDYVQSHDGQAAAAKSNMTPIREDVTEEEARLTFQRLAGAIGGESKLILCDYDNLPTTEEERAFIERWKTAQAK